MAHVTLCEMSPRDGLQFLGGEKTASPRLIPLEFKLRLIEALRAARLPYIEVGAFVSPKVTPQMADSDVLGPRLTARPDERLAALVPNARHYARFRASGLNTVALFVSASEAYAQANTRSSVEDLMTWAGEVAALARAEGKSLRAHVSAAFQELTAGATFDPKRVVDLTRRLIELGCACVALADTNGETNPRRIRELLAIVEREVGLEHVGVHLHDRNGAGLANALAALDAGVRTFDASLGGIGGSATAAGLKSGAARAAGNIATEELADMLERMGVQTGVDLDALARAGELLFEITRQTGDFAPPSRLLRERLGYGVIWAREPAG
ncbi:MAG: hydroxymethylglutaryl-CoA lyase [Phycisphaerae bacterium]